jgi:hypothetical protein
MGLPRRAHESIQRATDHCGLARFGCRRGRRRAKSQRTENRQRAGEHEANTSQFALVHNSQSPLRTPVVDTGYRCWRRATCVQLR